MNIEIKTPVTEIGLSQINNVFLLTFNSRKLYKEDDFKDLRKDFKDISFGNNLETIVFNSKDDLYDFVVNLASGQDFEQNVRTTDGKKEFKLTNKEDELHFSVGKVKTYLNAIDYKRFINKIIDKNNFNIEKIETDISNGKIILSSNTNNKFVVAQI